MPLSNIAPRRLEPGAAATIDPVGATDPVTVRWRHIGGIAPSWAYDTSGRCALSVPLSAVRGGTILMRAEEGWLPFPAPGLPVGSERVSYFSGATHQVDESVRHEGARTLKVTPTSAWDGAAFVAPVTPGKPYAFEAHIRSGTATPGYTVQLSVTWLNGSNATISNSSGPAVAPPNGTWGRITHSGTSPAGAASVRVQTMHSDLTNPQPYWLGFIGGRATDTALTIKDAAIEVAPSRVSRMTASGEVSASPREPSYLPLDTSSYVYVGGPIIGGATWSAHREGPSTSLLSVERDIGDPMRFRCIVGEPGLPGSGSVQRAELSSDGAGNYPFTRGTTYWWSFAFRMYGSPPSESGGWMNICQAHQTPDASDLEGPQPFGFYWLASGNLVATRRYDPNATTTGASFTSVDATGPTLVTDVWHRVVLRLRFDNGATSTGSLGVWFDGAPIVDVDNVPFGYNDTAHLYPKFGIYRGIGSGVNVAEFAAVEIGTTNLSSRVGSPLKIP